MTKLVELVGRVGDDSTQTEKALYHAAVAMRDWIDTGLLVDVPTVKRTLALVERVYEGPNNVRDATPPENAEERLEQIAEILGSVNCSEAQPLDQFRKAYRLAAGLPEERE